MIPMDRRTLDEGLAAAAGFAALKARASWGRTPAEAPDLILWNGGSTTLDATTAAATPAASMVTTTALPGTTRSRSATKRPFGAHSVAPASRCNERNIMSKGD